MEELSAGREHPFDPPLSAEPILGWRTWRLVRLDGMLVLESLTRLTVWPGRAAMRSECESCGSGGPGESCTCGLYAASTLEDLARSGALNIGASVVGAVAMWGRVVEHERGARAQFAYPARLRLVCERCLRFGKGAVDPKYVQEDAAGQLTAVCARHRESGRFGTYDARTMQSELLSTYAVDVVPAERVRKPLTFTRPRKPPTARGAFEAGFRGLELLLRLIMALIFSAWILACALAILGAVVSVFVRDAPSPRSVVAPVMSPVTSPSPDVRPSPMRPVPPSVSPSVSPPVIPDIAMPCGVGHGSWVEEVSCVNERADLMGFAVREAPRGAKHDCVTEWEAYSRGPNHWICWSALRQGVFVHPWPDAPNPFRSHSDEGGNDGNR